MEVKQGFQCNTCIERQTILVFIYHRDGEVFHSSVYLHQEGYNRAAPGWIIKLANDRSHKFVSRNPVATDKLVDPRDSKSSLCERATSMIILPRTLLLRILI